MGTRVLCGWDGMYYWLCLICNRSGRLCAFRRSAVRGRVEHDLPGGCEARRVESWVLNGIIPASEGSVVEYVDGTN
jgi:hypothetical protein